MKIKQILFFFLLLGLLFVFVGCGGAPEADDSDHVESIELPVDGEYFELSRIIDRRVSEETGEVITVESINKYSVSEVDDLSIKDGEDLRSLYAIVNFENRIEDDSLTSLSKSNYYSYYVIFEDRTISYITVDKELNPEDETPANLLEEIILCQGDLKQGYNWTSTNGYYTEVLRYEYIALSCLGRTAPSYKIATYEHKGDENPLYIYWWCPSLGWFVQLQDYENLNYFVLKNINFEWETEE